MKKLASEMVWPMEGYTDKIHFAVKYTFESNPVLAFSVNQMIDRIKGGFPWLTLDTERRQLLIHKLVKTAIAKLIQRDLVKQVYHKTQTEPQWMWARSVQESAYQNITSDDEIAKTPNALKACKGRAVSVTTIFKLNHAPTGSVAVAPQP